MRIKKYNPLSIPFFAFFSKRAYHEVARKWRGGNLAYLFVLLAICCLPPAIVIRQQIIGMIETNQAHLVNQIPDIQITNGRVIVDQSQPYNITRRDGSVAAIIDTTGSMNFIEDPKVMALLMEEALIVRKGSNQFKTYDLSEVRSFHLDRFIASNWINTVKKTMPQAAYGIFLLISYVFAVAVTIVTAIVSRIVAKVMGGDLGFGAAFRIVPVAATPAMIIMAVSVWAGIPVSLEILAGVSLIYLLVGIKASSQSTDAMDEGERVVLKSSLREPEVSGWREAA